MTADQPPPQCGGSRPPGGGDVSWRPPRSDDATVSAEARQWIRQVLPPMEPGCGPDLLEVAELVVSELVTNAMRHAGGLRRARLLRAGDVVRLAVQDCDPRPPVVTEDTDGDRIGGWGMQLVSALTADWGVCLCPDHGKCVWADLPSAGSPAAQPPVSGQEPGGRTLS